MKTLPPGLWIAFLGPDGVGKSAVIERLQSHSLLGSQEVTRFHFRPRFHTRALELQPVTSPHGRPPRGYLFSLAKLLYYLFDCWCGYWFLIRPRKSSGHCIVFDRYFPDILVDPLRYRLPIQTIRFARWLVPFVPRPDLYILLDAPAEVVQRRKSELSRSETCRQRTAYLEMFKEIPDKLLVNADCPVDAVARNVGLALRSLYPKILETAPSSLRASL